MRSSYYLLVGFLLGVELIMTLRLPDGVFMFALIALVIGSTLPDYDLETVKPFIAKLSNNK